LARPRVVDIWKLKDAQKVHRRKIPISQITLEVFPGLGCCNILQGLNKILYAPIEGFSVG
jgi:hypothetical protein